VASTELQSI